jgi:hypothetical protein
MNYKNEAGSGSRRAKMTTKIKKREEIQVLKCWIVLKC